MSRRDRLPSSRFLLLLTSSLAVAAGVVAVAVAQHQDQDGVAYDGGGGGWQHVEAGGHEVLGQVQESFMHNQMHKFITQF